MGLRQVVVQAINVLGTILLARIFTPEQFGFYAVCLFALSFLQSVGDGGLASSLIRQVSVPTTRELRVVFTAQMLIATMVVTVFTIATPWIATAYGAPAAWPIFALIGPALILASLQSIPAALLERRLDFGLLARVEVVQAVLFNAVAVVLAVTGAGVISIALAVLARAVVGAALVNMLQPWRIGVAWDWTVVRSHLAFGLPYQASSLVSVLKVSIGPVLVGLVAGPAAVGYLHWAQTVATYPALGLAVLQRLYLPAFAQMRAHPTELPRFVERVVTAANGLVAPLAVLTLVFIEPITRLVFGEQWLVAIPLFYWFWIASVLVPTGTPLVGLLNALGRPRTTFLFSVFWMLGTWVLGLPLVLMLGPLGYAIANAVVQGSNLVLYRVAQRAVGFRLVRPIAPSWLIAALSGIVVWLVARRIPGDGLEELIVLGTAGLAAYVIAYIMIRPSEARAIWSWFREGQTQA